MGCLIVGFVCTLFVWAGVASVSELFGRLVVGIWFVDWLISFLFS